MKEYVRIHKEIITFGVDPILQLGGEGGKLRKKSIHLVLSSVRRKIYFFPTLEIPCVNICIGRCGTVQLKLSRTIFLTDLSVLLLKKKEAEKNRGT